LDLIISHVNADFDCLGSLTAAGRLYPDALLCFPGSQEKTCGSSVPVMPI